LSRSSEDGGSSTAQLEDLDVPDATFGCPDLTTFCRLDELDRPGTSNGPTEAINGRREHLRGSALGFRNLTNYIARSLLETGGFRPRLHPALVKSRSSWGSAKDATETGNQ
jgi:Transposase